MRIIITEAWPLILVGLVVGLFLGGKLMEIKWRSNANALYRIESGGKLYKVLHDKDWKGERSKNE